MRRHVTYIWALWVICLLNAIPASAQSPVRYTSGEIYEAILKLRVLGSALYVAAHPDDENTRLISHLANDRKVHTTYLSLTRGDGGQNLIGQEIGDLLGVIRTQELLQARRIDGGHQRFTRANDFGYSKTPDETLDIWGEEEILADVVWTIRLLQPDVIINRFSSKQSPGNHGHHTASAILAEQAFTIAARDDAFPEQLQYVKPWQPSRTFFNTSWWFYGSRENFERADKSMMATAGVGEFNPVTSWSNNEIAARSRSMHKSQGFGATGTRGNDLEYLELVLGEMPADKTDVFAGIDISWERLKGGKVIDRMLASAVSAYDFRNPHLSIPALLEVRKAIASLEESVWKQRKMQEVTAAITACAGLWLEADAAGYHIAAGDSVSVTLEAINRSPADIELISARFLPSETDIQWMVPLNENVRHTAMRRVKIPAETPYSATYWLSEKGSNGLFAVEKQTLRGVPETPAEVSFELRIRIHHDTLSLNVPMIYKENDPVKGEYYRPFEIVPQVFVNLSAPVYIYYTTTSRPVEVTVKASSSAVNGRLMINVPNGWLAEPREADVVLAKPGDEARFRIELTPSAGAADGFVEASVLIDGRQYDQMITEVIYDHIPAQTVLRKAEARVALIDLQRTGRRVAYVHGAGDDVPAGLEQMGYNVDYLAVQDITGSEMLKRFDAVVLGVRAYNTQDRLRFVQQYLFDYVKEGGTLITQYNTSQGLSGMEIAPYPMRIGRGRVTNEESDVVFLAPDHPVLNVPNRLGPSDFEGWVQERGLYFGETWDDAFVPVLGMADHGEEMHLGALLVAQHGEGYFVYTGLSLFRQIPSGVPGAYRLLANLIALGNSGKS